MGYMSISDIRTLSRRIPIIVNASSEEIGFWADEAKDVIDAFCQQSFDFEKQTTKTIRATTSTLIYLQKPLTGEVTVKGDNDSSMFSTMSHTYINNNIPSVWIDVPVDTQYRASNVLFELFPGSPVIGYYGNNGLYRSPNAKIMTVTGDWGYKLTIEDLLIDAANEMLSSFYAHKLDDTVHLAPDTLDEVDVTPIPVKKLSAAINLVNDLRDKITDHMTNINGSWHTNPDTDTPDSEPVATDISTALKLLYVIKTKFNDHLSRDDSADTPIHLLKDKVNTSVINLDDQNAVMPRAIRRAFLRVVQRIAIRSDYEDHRQFNTAYASESLGDEYSYDLSNGTLRNLIRPEEAQMLLPYVNRGRIVV